MLRAQKVAAASDVVLKVCSGTTVQDGSKGRVIYLGLVRTTLRPTNVNETPKNLIMVDMRNPHMQLICIDPIYHHVIRPLLVPASL